MPVHETEGGYQYGKTGKVYKSKKKAIKQAVAIAYSKAREKGRKPTSEEVKEEISGNPDEKITKKANMPNIRNNNMSIGSTLRLRYTKILQKQASLNKEASLKKTAFDFKPWIESARRFVNSEAFKRGALGAGVAGATYLASGLADPEGRYKAERGIGSILAGGFAGYKGLELIRAMRNFVASRRHASSVDAAVKRGTEAQAFRGRQLDPRLAALDTAPIKSNNALSLAERLNEIASPKKVDVSDKAVGERAVRQGTDYLLRNDSPAREAADAFIIDQLPLSDPRWVEALERVKLQYK